jgi:hypothetical protein
MPLSSAGTIEDDQERVTGGLDLAADPPVCLSVGSIHTITGLRTASVVQSATMPDPLSPLSPSAPGHRFGSRFGLWGSKTPITLVTCGFA